MNSDFSKYKKQLEDYLIKIDFIYSGDVINSDEVKYTKRLKSKSFSSIFISEIMCKIYDWSFKKMINESKEIIVYRNKFSDIYNFLDEYSMNSKILFYSKNSNLNLNLGGPLLEKEEVKYLPDYFMRRFKLMSYGKEVSAYYSPLIDDFEDDCSFYLVDRPVQSMVWSLQNMSYDISKIEDEWLHEVRIPIYNCDYNSYKVRVVDTEKIREEKINTLLDEN
jgi:hypothetical protein